MAALRWRSEEIPHDALNRNEWMPLELKPNLTYMLLRRINILLTLNRIEPRLEHHYLGRNGI